MAKRDERKETDSKGKTKAERHSATTEAHKQVRITRQSRLQDRPDAKVSENCRKNRGKRQRKRDFARNFKTAKAAERKTMVSPTETGARQFGEKAKGHHLHQRAHGLATALTPAEFKKWEERRKQSEKTAVVMVEE